jgi:hypothetical protein
MINNNKYNGVKIIAQTSEVKVYETFAQVNLP